MKISIGIPVRNGEAFLRDAIISALQQTRPANEILVIDDSSTDGTKAIATASEWGGRIRYHYSDSPSGFADAFNRLAQFAEGDYLSILCADDLLDAECLALLEKGLLKFPQADFCHAGFRLISADGEPMSASLLPQSQAGVLLDGRQYARDLIARIKGNANVHRCVAFLVRTELMRSQCPFRKEAGLIGDTDFLVRISSLTQVVQITEPLGSIRSHLGSVTQRLHSIPLQLSKDYLFQIKSEKNRRPSPDLGLLRLYSDLAVRYLDHLFVESISLGRNDQLAEAFRLQAELVDLLPSYWQSRKRFGREALWRHAGGGGGKLLLRYLTKASKQRRHMKNMFAASDQSADHLRSNDGL